MHKILEWVQGFAMGIGGPGLFLVAFLDSSFLSLPEINDVLVVLMVVGHPAWWPYYAAMATLGSLAGCLTIYWLARKGGQRFLEKRLQGGSSGRAVRLFQRYGLLAIVVPALLPPPAPFKLFVLLAGVARVPVMKFGAAILVGRGLRYVLIGFFSALYGERVLTWVKENGALTSLVLALVILAGAVAWMVWRSRRARNADAAA